MSLAQKRRWTVVAALITLAAAAAWTLASIATARAEEYAVAVAERHSDMADAAARDEAFFRQAAEQAAEARAERAREALQPYLEQRDEASAAAQEALEASEGKVLDEQVRDELAAAISEGEDARHRRALEEATELLTARTEAVTEAVDEWQAEQERIAEERRRVEEQRRAEEEAARRAAQTQRSSSSSSSSSTSSSSSSRRGGGASTQGSSSGGGGGSVRDIATAALARHGCGSVPVYWDDSRLAGWNGAAMIGGNEQILLNSRMPVARAGYVAAHECAHILQSRVYGHDLNALDADLDSIYGGNGVEQNADCITMHWGYSAYNYTRSCGGERGAAARAIASGQRA